MPLNQQEIINVCKQIAEQEQLQVCVVESTKGACIAGGTALVGGLLGGPLGLGVGGVLGSLYAAMKGKGKYKSVAEVIMYDMTDSQQAKLVQSVHKILEDIGIEDLQMLACLVMTNGSLQKAILMELTKFLKSEMNLAIA